MKGTSARSHTACQRGDVLYELAVTDLTVEGYGVARHQGRVVFVDGALPGSVVSARVSGTKKNIPHATVESVSSLSPHAVTPWCPHAKECGACLWQHFSREASLAWKHKHVSECLARIGKCADIPVESPTASPASRAFRNKMAFAFAPGPEGKPFLGLRRRHSREILPVSHCGLQRSEVMDLLAYVREAIERLGLCAWSEAGTKRVPGRRGYLRFLVVHTPDHRPDGLPQLLVECITSPDHEGRAGGRNGRLTNAHALRKLGLELMERFSLTGFLHTERKAQSAVAQGERVLDVLGARHYTEQFGHLRLRVPYNAFLQTNTALATLLYARIGAEAALNGEQVLWDVYSGVGSIALYLAERVKEAHGIEIQAESVAAAKENSVGLGYSHCHFHAGKLTAQRASSLSPPDVIIADPPRAGLEQEVIEVLLHTSTARTLLYLSCDVSTQARDIARLSPRWNAVKSIPFDMFPYTPHVENLVVLKQHSEY